MAIERLFERRGAFDSRIGEAEKPCARITRMGLLGNKPLPDEFLHGATDPRFLQLELRNELRLRDWLAPRQLGQDVALGRRITAARDFVPLSTHIKARDLPQQGAGLRHMNLLSMTTIRRSLECNNNVVNGNLISERPPPGRKLSLSERVASTKREATKPKNLSSPHHLHRIAQH